MKNVVDVDKQPEMMDKLTKGIFTLRDMYEQFQVRLLHDILCITHARTL